MSKRKETFYLKALRSVAWCSVRMRRAQIQHGGCAALTFPRQYYANGRICFNFLAKKKETEKTKTKIKLQCLDTGMFEGIITMKVIHFCQSELGSELDLLTS